MENRLFGSLHPDVEDRRDQMMSPADEARLILGAGPPPGHYDPSELDQVPVNQLGIDLGMLDIDPGHQMWLARRKLAQELAIRANPEQLKVHRQKLDRIP